MKNQGYDVYLRHCPTPTNHNKNAMLSIVNTKIFPFVAPLCF